MKIILALILSLFCLTSFAATGAKPVVKDQQQASIQKWFSYYYRDKNASRIPESIKNFAAEKLLSKPVIRDQYVAFYAELFKQDPSQLNYWLKTINTLSLNQQAVVWQAVWQSNTPQARQYLQKVRNSRSSETVRKQIALIEAKPPINYLKAPIKTYNDVAALWGGFFATGNKAYIGKIITVLNWKVSDKNKSRLNTSFLVRYNLATYAQTHPIVLSALQNQLKTASTDQRDAIQRILKYVKLQASKQTTT